MWASIEGYKFPYRISDEGVAQKLHNGEWVSLSPRLHNGHTNVTLRTKDGGRTTVPLARLVADAFMGGYKPGMCIIHKNGSKLDCSVYNLKLGTFSDCGKIGGKFTCKTVLKLDEDWNVVEIYRSAAEAARKNFFEKSAISMHCRGKRAKAATDGYYYRYEDEFYRNKPWSKKTVAKEMGGYENVQKKKQCPSLP